MSNRKLVRARDLRENDMIDTEGDRFMTNLMSPYEYEIVYSVVLERDAAGAVCAVSVETESGMYSLPADHMVTVVAHLDDTGEV